jgi:Uma2 family endonuclease
MSSLMEIWPRRHRITVDEYYRMAEVGLLAPDARVELIEGEIIDMAPIGTDHNGVVNQLSQLFNKAVVDLAIVQTQGVVRLDGSSEPQPDLALLVPREDFYGRAHPSPADVLMLIEVSDSTLVYDRDVKIPLYARHGIPEVWIVDLQNKELRIYRSPAEGKYVDQSVMKEPGVMLIAAVPGVKVDLSRLLRVA